MSVYRMTELVIQELERYPNIIEFIQSIHVIANDKIGQTPAKFDNVTDKKNEVVCGMNVHKVNKFILATYDPTQPQPIRGRPCVILCHKITPIKVLSAHKMVIFGIQQISRNSYK